MRLRSRLTSVSTLRGVTKVWSGQTRASSASRLKTMPGCEASRYSRRNSCDVSSTSLAAHPHPPARRVELDAVHRHRTIAGLRRRRQFAGPGPPQQRPHPGDELADAERLGQVVVGAALETDDGVGLLAAGGQHQHRGVDVGPAAPQRLAHGDAVHAGQHQVEHHQVEAGRGQPGEGLAAVAHVHRLQPFEAEVQPDQLTDVRVVLDDQNMGHGSILRGRGRRRTGRPPCHTLVTAATSRCHACPVY